MKRFLLLSGWMFVASMLCSAQSLEKMQWFNEPENWEIKDNLLSMYVTPQTDYWRISQITGVYLIMDLPSTTPLFCILCVEASLR